MTGVRDVKGSTVRILADNAIIGPTINEVINTSYGAPPNAPIVAYATAVLQTFATSASTQTVTYGTTITVLNQYATATKTTGSTTPVITITTTGTNLTNSTMLATGQTNYGKLQGVLNFNPAIINTGTATATSTISSTSTPTIFVTVAATCSTPTGTTVFQSQNTINADFFTGTVPRSFSMICNFLAVTNGMTPPTVAVVVTITNNCSQQVSLLGGSTLSMNIY